MKYQKPKVVAKSAPKQSFVAGCPQRYQRSGCHLDNMKCQCGMLD